MDLLPPVRAWPGAVSGAAPAWDLRLLREGAPTGRESALVTLRLWEHPEGSVGAREASAHRGGRGRHRAWGTPSDQRYIADPRSAGSVLHEHQAAVGPQPVVAEEVVQALDELRAQPCGRLVGEQQTGSAGD